jgi:molybdate transport system ATP-binding protein
MSLLEFEAQLRYPSGFELDVAFQSDAAVTALFGPSGSGKTSVLSLVAGLRSPDRGRIAVAGRVLYSSAERVHLPPEDRRIGYVFQDHLLFPHLSVRENLMYGHRRRQPGAREVDFAQAVEVLELGPLVDRAPHTLSGGQRQRVALGRAILAGPELLLMDEPLASLDESLKDRIMEYLERAQRQWSIPTLYVTHERRELHRLAAWVVVLEHGRVVRTGTPAEALAAASNDGSEEGAR